jgi:hypothetical protein
MGRTTILCSYKPKSRLTASDGPIRMHLAAWQPRHSNRQHQHSTSPWARKCNHRRPATEKNKKKKKKKKKKKTKKKKKKNKTKKKKRVSFTEPNLLDY